MKKDTKDETLEVKLRNPINAVGFAMMSHVITLDLRITDGAYRLYALILKYARQHGKAWPSGVTLARLLDKSDDTIYRRFENLEQNGYIEREYRPGKQSILWVNDLTTNESLLNIAKKLASPPPVGVEKETTRKNAGTPPAKMRVKEEEEKEQTDIHNSGDSEDEIFDEGIEYVDPGDEFGDAESSRKEPKWKTKYGKDNQGQTDLLFRAFAATGKRSNKFATHQECKDWNTIALKVYSLKDDQEAGKTNVYPLEWIDTMIVWAHNKNKRHRGSIKFASLLSAIMNTEKCDEFINKYHKSKEGQKKDDEIITKDPDTGMVRYGQTK